MKLYQLSKDMQQILFLNKLFSAVKSFDGLDGVNDYSLNGATGEHALVVAVCEDALDRAVVKTLDECFVTKSH